MPERACSCRISWGLFSTYVPLSRNPSSRVFCFCLANRHDARVPTLTFVFFSLPSKGLAVLGSRKKESLCIKVDKALGQMLKAPLDDADLSDPDAASGESDGVQDASAIAAAKKAARTVITVLMSAYKFPEVHV